MKIQAPLLNTGSDASAGEKVPLKGIVRYVYKTAGKAIARYNMIQENDRVLLAVSGGVDSMVLLTLLLMRQRYVPIDFEVVACYVRGDSHRGNERGLLAYLKEQRIAVVVRELRLKKAERVNCFWCSWNRRKLFFETMRERGCTKLAMGHHMDDILETLLMNMCSHGELSIMKPALSFFNGEFTMIRPLCGLQKKTLAAFARELRLPDFKYRCPYGDRGTRMKVRRVVEMLDGIFPNAKLNMYRSLGRIKEDYLL